jgi:hypothetical protein
MRHSAAEWGNLGAKLSQGFHISSRFNVMASAVPPSFEVLGQDGRPAAGLWPTASTPTWGVPFSWRNSGSPAARMGCKVRGRAVNRERCCASMHAGEAPACSRSARGRAVGVSDLSHLALEGRGRQPGGLEFRQVTTGAAHGLGGISQWTGNGWHGVCN